MRNARERWKEKKREKTRQTTGFNYVPELLNERRRSSKIFFINQQHQQQRRLRRHMQQIYTRTHRIRYTRETADQRVQSEIKTLKNIESNERNNRKCLSMVLVRRRFCEWIFNFAPAQTRTHTEWQHRQRFDGIVCAEQRQRDGERKAGDRTHIFPLKAWARMRTITFENLCVDWPSANHEHRPTVRPSAQCQMSHFSVSFGFAKTRICCSQRFARISPQWPVSGHFRSHSYGTMSSFCMETNVHFRMFTLREVGRQLENLFATHDRALGYNAFASTYNITTFTIIEMVDVERIGAMRPIERHWCAKRCCDHVGLADTYILHVQSIRTVAPRNRITAARRP